MPSDRNRPPLTPWERLIRASERGTGVRLSPDEVWWISSDSALATRAALDADMAHQHPDHHDGDEDLCPWCRPDSYRPAIP